MNGKQIVALCYLFSLILCVISTAYSLAGEQNTGLILFLLWADLAIAIEIANFLSAREPERLSIKADSLFTFPSFFRTVRPYHSCPAFVAPSFC